MDSVGAGKNGGSPRNGFTKFFTPVRIIALSFLGIIATGTLLLMLPAATRQGSTGFTNALFTATSATCVTGLTVYDTYTHWSYFGQAVILALIQVGGLGFMTFFSALALALKRNIQIREQKILAETSAAGAIGGITSLLKRIVLGTAGFEIAGTLLLAIRFCRDFGFFKGLYISLFHAVSAFCNAGFDIIGIATPGQSLTAYRGDPLVILTVSALILIGGLGFIVWSDLVKCRFSFRKFSLHTKISVTVTCVLIVIPTALFLIFENNTAFENFSAGEKLLNAFFMAVTPRTAGFFTVDYGSISESGSLLTMLLMFTGGCPGSTAGGVKTTTIAVLAATLAATVRGRDSAVAFKRRISPETVRSAIAVGGIYITVDIAAACLVCAVGGFTIREGLFEVISATGTVGLTCGITPRLDTFLKYVIVFLMYAGRVGLLSLAIALGRPRRRQQSERPTEFVAIG